MAHAGFKVAIFSTRLHGHASPPSTRQRRGKMAAGSAAESRAARWVGTILRQSISFFLKYSAKRSGSDESSSAIRCKAPPLHNAEKTAVFPKSAAIVETLAKLLPAGRSSVSQMALV